MFDEQALEHPQFGGALIEKFQGVHPADVAAEMPVQLEPMSPMLCELRLSFSRSTYSISTGFDLSRCPLVRRKALLKTILPKDNTGRVRFTDHVIGSGEQLFEKLEALELEGMLMKRKNSVYSGLRSRDWLKVKPAAGRLTMHKEIKLGVKN